MLLITGIGWLGCAFWAHLHCSWQVYSFLPRLLFFFLLLFSAFPIAFWWMFLLWGVNDPMLNSLGFDIASGTFCLLLLYFLCKYCSPSFSLRLCLSVHLHDLIIINVHLNVIRLPFQLCSKALARSFMKIKCTPTVCPTSFSLKEKGRSKLLHLR